MDSDLNINDKMIALVRRQFPGVQAIYLFGTFGTNDEKPGSDADIALLLDPVMTRGRPLLATHPLRAELSESLAREVDLINLRAATTVFQKEVIMAERRIYTGSRFAAEEFECLVLSFYQKLNDERSAIIEAGLRDGRFYKI